MKLTRNEILGRGTVELRVTTGGIIQRQKFTVVREKTAFGMVPFLVCQVPLGSAELVRLAEEYQLPVKSATARAFPKGKMAKDFAGL